MDRPDRQRARRAAAAANIGSDQRQFEAGIVPTDRHDLRSVEVARGARIEDSAQTTEHPDHANFLNHLAQYEPRVFLHRGIATRAFERRFALADHVRVTGASHEHGMLHIDLQRETPEALKPRRIEIARTSGAQVIDSAAVAAQHEPTVN